jgi:ferredoxin--NADP+ reductase
LIPEGEGTIQQERNLKILQTFAERPAGANEKKLHIRFLVSPTEVIADGDGNVAGIALEKNRLEVNPDGTASARGTGEIEILDTGMVLPAIGYAAQRIAGVPYDEKARIIANENGRVVDSVTRGVIANEYVVGWARSGPQGLIGSHKGASARVVDLMIADGAGLDARELPDREVIVDLLRERGLQTVSFNDWKQLDDVEVARGARRGAPRDKLADVEAMLAVLAPR